MIELKGVTRTYELGGELIYALNNLNLKIVDGEFLAIIGPSGSGKSTLANIIGGLDSPTAGQVLVDTEDLAHEKDRALSVYRNKKIGFIFQTFNLQPQLTALENASLPLLLRKVKLKERNEKALECLNLVGLGDRLNHKPSQLSGG